jgi:hypothetical protein
MPPYSFQEPSNAASVAPGPVAMHRPHALHPPPPVDAGSAGPVEDDAPPLPPLTPAVLVPHLLLLLFNNFGWFNHSSQGVIFRSCLSYHYYSTTDK